MREWLNLIAIAGLVGTTACSPASAESFYPNKTSSNRKGHPPRNINNIEQQEDSHRIIIKDPSEIPNVIDTCGMVYGANISETQTLIQTEDANCREKLMAMVTPSPVPTTRPASASPTTTGVPRRLP